MPGSVATADHGRTDALFACPADADRNRIAHGLAVAEHRPVGLPSTITKTASALASLGRILPGSVSTASPTAAPSHPCSR